MKVIKIECCEDCPWSRLSCTQYGIPADLWQCALPGEQGEDWITIQDPYAIPEWCSLPDGMVVETSAASSTDVYAETYRWVLGHVLLPEGE